MTATVATPAPVPIDDETGDIVWNLDREGVVGCTWCARPDCAQLDEHLRLHRGSESTWRSRDFSARRAA
jgi:hypothetical protein